MRRGLEDAPSYHSSWALTQRHAWVRGALELLEHAILLDAARDDDGGGDAVHFVGEVDLLGWLRAPELVDLIRVTIDTGKGEVCGVSAGIDTKANALGRRRTPVLGSASP